MGALNIKSTSGLLILGGQELFWIPPISAYAFLFFLAHANVSRRWHRPLSAFFSLGVSAIRCNAWSFQQWNRFARTRMVVSNFAQGSPRVSWAYGTFACRPWWKHASRTQKIMVYDVPIILGQSWSYIIYTIKSINQTLHFDTFCIFAFLSMNLTSTLDKVTSGPPETLFGGLVPTHWQSGVLAGLPRAVWACSGAENDRFWPCSMNKLRLFWGDYQFRTQTLVDVCWCLLLVILSLSVLPSYPKWWFELTSVFVNWVESNSRKWFWLDRRTVVMGWIKLQKTIIPGDITSI